MGRLAFEYRITRQDGYWVADGTGPYPLVALNDLRSGGTSDADRDLPTADKAFLVELVGLGGKKPLAQQTVVGASWSSPDGINCHITTVLVDPAKAELAALALVTSQPSHMWLPTLESHDEDEARFRRDGLEPCEPWISHIQKSENLDECDPFGSLSAISIYRSAKSVIEGFGLSTKDPWSQVWFERDEKTAFRYRAWGGWQGEGESEKRDSGHALYCERSFLTKLLTELDRNLIVLVKLQRYHERKRYGGGEEEDGKFSHSFLVTLVDKNLNVTQVEPLQKHVEAVSKLDQYDIHDFAERLRALRALYSD